MNMENLALQPTLHANRFVMRPPKKSDLGPFEMHAGDERIARMTRDIPHPLPPGSIEAFIARAQAPTRSEGIWVLDGTASSMGEVMGVVSLERMDRNQCEVGFWVVPGLWRTGIATEAVKTVIEATPLGCRTFFATVFQDNPASARLLTNLGFSYIGDAEYFSVARRTQVPTWTYLRQIE